MLISPLARKLCAAQGIDPARLRGSGPRGRIMAADVQRPTEPMQTHRGAPQLADYTLLPTRDIKDGYYVYDDEVNMKALADISLPIAVQCEKLLENRYSLFDYIVRAVVKACIGAVEWQPQEVNVLLFDHRGQHTAAIPDAAGKTIYRLARETQAATTVPQDYCPHIIVCDAQTTRAQVAEYLGAHHRPSFALVVRGLTPKVGIRAGRGENYSDYLLPYTFYASAQAIPGEVANHVAANLRALLYNPVRLLLLS